MSFTSRARVVRLVSAGVAAAAAVAPLAAQAGPTTINATQLSIQVAPITISGTKLGAEVSATGSGLSSATNLLPSISATGATGAANMAADANSTFSFAVAARSADEAATSNQLGTDLVPTTAFGTQSGTFGTGAANAGSISLSGAGVPDITAATGPGVTASATYSSSATSDVAQTQVRRIATSSTDQASFTATRQGSSFAFSGSGLTGVTAGGLEAGVVGAAPAITTRNGGATQANVAFTASQSQLTGQDSAAMTATTTDVTQPGYGVVTNQLGGSTAGAITAATGFNSLGVAAGEQGSSSTLSVIQSLTAF